MPEVLDNISCDIAPVADSHLANKAYVDAAVAGNGTASVSGDNVVSIPAQALISCAIAPTENSHLANKAYVDAAVAAAGTATPVEEPAGLGKVVIVNTLSDAASHTGTSLRDAINAVASNGNVLIKFSVSGTITLEQGEITTTGNIAIDGENKITISGGGVSRIFYIAANTSLKLYRLTLTGGNGIGQSSSDTGTIYGGVAYVYGSSTSNGGALFAKAVTFTGNSISSANATAAQGAVVHMGNYAAGILTDCTFSNNAITVTKASSTAYGGCISLGRTGFVRCDKSTFSGNSVSCLATAQGGAVYGGTVELADCTFINNQLTGGSTRKGGAICTGTGTIDIIGCEFSGNSVSTASSNCQGGAVFVSGTQTVNIVDCDFSGNTAYYGSVYVNGGRICRILRSVFNNNTVHGSGRGVALYVTAVSADIEDCEFKNNVVGAASGIIYVYGSTGNPTVTINRCRITGNSATAATTGLIYIANAGQVYLYNTVFTANSFTSSSGNHKCVYTTGANTWAYIYNCTFTNNSAKGGAFYAAAGGVDIYNSVEYGNGSASGKGTNATVNAEKFLSDQASTGRDITYDSTKPLFAADGFTPAANSQVIDKGLAAHVMTEYDLNGKARVSGTAVDLGAVEYQSA